MFGGVRNGWRFSEDGLVSKSKNQTKTKNKSETKAKPKSTKIRKQNQSLKIEIHHSLPAIMVSNVCKLRESASIPSARALRKCASYSNNNLPWSIPRDPGPPRSTSARTQLMLTKKWKQEMMQIPDPEASLLELGVVA